MRQVVGVVVNDVYLHYVWKGDEPLKVGDVVKVRQFGPGANPADSFTGTVIDPDTSYDGKLVIIREKVSA